MLPAAAVPALLVPLPIPKLRGLGGKFGETVRVVHRAVTWQRGRRKVARLQMSARPSSACRLLPARSS